MSDDSGTRLPRKLLEIGRVIRCWADLESETHYRQEINSTSMNSGPNRKISKATILKNVRYILTTHYIKH
jgi:hypothetical protein